MEKLFDLSQEYDSMLNQGLKYSGEAKEYFIHGRIKDLIKALPNNAKINKILDYGCGIGDTSAILKHYFKEAEITGTDLSIEALKYANTKYADLNIRFLHLEDIPVNYFDLVYVNGVFHHILPVHRIKALKEIYDSLKNSGFFALFENNPWNIGTKIVMKKIPFDKDARTINPIKAKLLIKTAGFESLFPNRYLFYFPKALSYFRFFEKFLVKLPLGAQYHVLSQKNNF